MSHDKIIFRADGSNKMGLGHLVRSMALAEMLSENFTCQFWVNKPDAKLIEMVKASFDCRVLDFATIDQEIRSLKTELKSTDILVLDGYQFDANYQNALKPFVYKMICVDDLASTHFHADLIINHGSAEIIQQYKSEPYTKILAGPGYVILRKPFREAAINSRRNPEKIDTLFVCMGGSDPFNITNKVLSAALQAGFVKKIIIVIGTAYCFQEEMNEIITKHNYHKEIILERNISAEKLVALIRSSQLAICPSSSIALEVASVKCGLLTGMVINNQQAIHDMIIQSNCAKSVGDFNAISKSDLCKQIEEMNDSKVINELIENQSSFIDGFSGRRIVEEFKILSEC